MKEFEHIERRIDLHERGGIVALELGIRLFAGGFQFLEIVIVQKFIQYGRRALGVTHGKHGG